MKKLILTAILTTLAISAPSFGQPSVNNTPDKSTVSANASAPSTQPKTPNTDKTSNNKAKTCNPKKSKPCGNGCIPLKRTCRKK